MFYCNCKVCHAGCATELVLFDYAFVPLICSTANPQLFVSHHVTSLHTVYAAHYCSTIHLRAPKDPIRLSKATTQHNSTVPIVTPVFPYYIPFAIPHYTRLLHSTRNNISRQFNTSTNISNKVQPIQYNSWPASNCYMFRHRSSIHRQTPEQRNTSTVRLYTWIRLLELYVFVTAGFLKMALRCRNM